MSSSIVGALLATVVMIWAIFDASAGNFYPYFNFVGLVIVAGGTLSAAIISFKVEGILILVRTLIKVMQSDRVNQKEIVGQLVKIAQLKAPKGQFGVKFATAHPFIVDGLRLVDNDFEPQAIESIMTTAAIERKNTFLKEIEVLRTLAKYPPAFGMVGTVLGLVALLQGLSGSVDVKMIGPAMGIALLTTLYGLALTNYIFTPIGDNLANRLKDDIQIRKIIIKGITLLSKGQDAVFIEESLNVYLLPSQRTTASFSNDSTARRAA